MTGRNRSEGWQRAKLSGHKNEDIIESLLLNDMRSQSDFLSRIGIRGVRISRITGGGIGERQVPSVLASGDLTTPKTDMYLYLDDGTRINCSIKKSPGGQVYLVTVDNFIDAYEGHFESMPAEIKRAIKLYWGGAPDIKDLLREHGKCADNYERKRQRLTGDSLKSYNESLYKGLIDWFQSNIGKVTELCFSRGAAANPEDWADYVWYKNELNENPLDAIFSIKDICEAAKRNSSLIFYRNRTHGSTIQMPFGFVQWHCPGWHLPGSLQFHHDYAMIKGIISNL